MTRRAVLSIAFALFLSWLFLAYSLRPQPEVVHAGPSFRTLPTSPPLVPELGDVAALGRAQTTTTRPVADIWTRIAACESGGDWTDTRGGYEGGPHFTSQTWLAYGGAEFAPHANLASREQQIVVARRVLAGQGPRAWPVCSVKVGLTRSNG